SVCYFGEAAVNQGAFHEALNMAALWKLPVVYICENNRYGMGTALERASSLWDISRRSRSYDMPSEVVDGMDVVAMYEATKRAADLARSEKIPTLLEARTYRFMGHSMSDPIHGHYRTREEVEQHKERDPIRTFSESLKSAGILTRDELAGMEEEVASEIADAARFAEESPAPDPSELYDNVYAL
ncbi:MAG: thiamine pyrophosphate-dependent dehydrogenase E1 component subunit alpha, partial [Gemmatimonadales bacterium]